MIHLTAQTQILVAIDPVDFRKQADGLIALTKRTLRQDPRSGILFAFINKARTMIRVLCYRGNGYWVATKRLSRGRYQGWPSHKEVISEVSAKELIQDTLDRDE